MRHFPLLALAPLAVLFSACTDMKSPSPTAASNSTGAAVQKVPTPAAAPLDKEGYVHQWLILGPINFGSTYNADEIDKEQIPREAALTPRAGDHVTVKSEETQNGSPKMIDKTLTWQPITTADHVLDFNDAFKLETSDTFGGYAMAYLVAPEDLSDLTLSFSTNDDGKLYLNGKSIWSLVAGRALAEDSDTVEHVTLHKGSNPLLLKVWNDAGNWQACLRILDKSGKPVTNVTVSLQK